MPSDPLNPKRRGRPRTKNPLPEGVEQNGIAVHFEDKRGDVQVITDVKERFEALEMYAHDIGDGKINSMIVSGAAGIGKTYALLKVLEAMHGKDQVRFHRTAGFVSTIEMYRLLFEYRHAGDVLMFDDTDNIFYDDNTLNILKGALDSLKVRTLSYRTKSTVDLGEDGDVDDLEEGEVPNEFQYEGTCIFVTNIDFYAYLSGPKTRITPHIEALMNRTRYLDMALHQPRAVALWIQHMVTTEKMLLSPEHGLTKQQSDDVLAFIVEHYPRIHKPSLRTAVLIAQDLRNHPDRWQALAKLTRIKPAGAK